MSVGTSFDYNLTRDGIVKNAYRKVTGTEPNTARMKFGVETLNLIMRELDPESRQLWAVTKDASTITLIANTFLYTTSNGLASDILELETMHYRDSSGTDVPVTIGSNRSYEEITDKFSVGDPFFVYLTESISPALRQLYIVSALSSVNDQSEVVGTGALNWRCIRTHTADSTNKPVTGDNYLLYWEQAGSSGAAWADGTQYTAPQLLRYTYRRPLWDFDLSRDNPDVPQSWIRQLTYRLASDLADDPTMEVAVSVRSHLDVKGARAKHNVESSKQKKTTNFHNKVEFF